MYYQFRYALGKAKLRIKEASLTRRYKLGHLKTQNLETLLHLQGKFAGQRCFIIGNGPSLKKLDLSHLKSEHCFLFNGAYELIDKLNLQNANLAIEDRLVMQDHYTKVNQLACRTFIPSDLRHFISSPHIIETFFSRSSSENSHNWPPFVDTSLKRPVFYWGGTVAYYGIQLAAWMGFSDCYIIGVDLTYSIPDHVIKKGSVLLSNGDDPNHYDPNYFGKGKRWHVPRPERMLTAFRSINEKTIGADMRIFNAGLGGNLDCFTRVNFEDCFNVRP